MELKRRENDLGVALQALNQPQPRLEIASVRACVCVCVRVCWRASRKEDNVRGDEEGREGRAGLHSFIGSCSQTVSTPPVRNVR